MKETLIILSLLTANILSSGQVVINEIGADATNFDGYPANQTAEFIELYNSGSNSVDISGWILIDDGAAIRIPTGTTLASDDYYLMGSYGRHHTMPGENGLGSSCHKCDYRGLPLDGNWGTEQPNLQTVGEVIIGKYCQGTNNNDEAWLLLDNNLNIMDAVYFGDDGNYCNYTAQTFTLPTFGSLPSVSIQNSIAPHDGSTPTVVAGMGVSNPNNKTWSYAGPALNGGNSSYIRNPYGGSWANGAIDNWSLQNTGTYTQGAQPTTQPTNHPTPGIANDSTPYTFEVITNGILLNNPTSPTDTAHYLLSGTEQINFKYKINNYQNVVKNNYFSLLQSPNYIGGVRYTYTERDQNEGSGRSSWSQLNDLGNGTKELIAFTPNSNPVSPLQTSEKVYTLIWSDYAMDCCGTTDMDVVQGQDVNHPAWEHYERRHVKVTSIADIWVDPFAPVEYDCSSYQDPGIVDIKQFIQNHNFNNTYELVNNTNVISTNKTGVFAVDNSLPTPLKVRVKDDYGQVTPYELDINNNCLISVTCPSLMANSALSNVAGTYCPGDYLFFYISSTGSSNLLPGAKVDWHRGPSPIFNIGDPGVEFIKSSYGVGSGNNVSPTIYQIPNKYCNQGPFYVRGFLSPIKNSCSAAAATTAALGPYDILCPTVSISGDAPLCGIPGNTIVDIPLISSVPITGGSALLEVNNNNSSTQTTIIPASGSSSAHIELPRVENFNASVKLINVQATNAGCDYQVVGPNKFTATREVDNMHIVVGECTGPVSDEITVHAVLNEPADVSQYTLITPSIQSNTNTTGTFVLPSGYTGVVRIEAMVNGCYVFGLDTVMDCDPAVGIPFALDDIHLTAHGHPLGTLLHWEALDDQHISYVIEKSTDAILYHQLGSMPTNTKGEYSFIDTTEIHQMTYYRLKIYHQNGSIKYSNIASMRPNEKAKKLSIYPTPTSGELKISLSSSTPEDLNIQLYDIEGRLILQKELKHKDLSETHSLDLEHLSPGPYIIRLQSGTHNESHIITKK